MELNLFAHEALQLTVEGLGDAMFINLRDPENESAELLAHLQKLYHQRVERDQARSSYGAEPYSRSSSFSATPVIDEEEDSRECWRVEQESYKELVADGGRPSHPLSFGIDEPKEPGEYKDIIWFWRCTCGYSCAYTGQRNRWKQFRQFQDQMRRFYVPRNRFQEYKNTIQRSQAEIAHQWDLRVLEDRHRQDRLEDWNEFRAFYFRKLKQAERRIEPAKQELALDEKAWADGRIRFYDAIADSDVVYGRLNDIIASEHEIAKAKSRVESAEKASQAALSRSDTRAVEIAEQELFAAKAELEAVSGSDELRRLRDGYDLIILERRVRIAQGHLRGLELDVKMWTTYVKWIDDQYLAIAAECGHPVNNGNPSLGESLWNARDEETRNLRPRPHRRDPARSKSVLGSNHSSRISKPDKTKPSRRHNTQSSCSSDPEPSMIQSAVGDAQPPRRSTRLQNLHAKKAAQVPGKSILGPVSPSRVTKVKLVPNTKKRDISSGRRPRQREQPATNKAHTKPKCLEQNNDVRRSRPR
ncbi:hypothetical protein Z517_09890 [Fonsecaea pedrosoi CBS 271.37]|uniref:Uncharacterized protein n=1 Tax=Fonsecaea pedrosoi CBS 271.37 TaxID=1442368 RepID=A0A0D2GYJ8_9EURO|nr:uncharacterized protein Z517_09890 [Fonsecaea pedrosoi CBS 271.37]KIW77444.1 hypothetical protein Z517_09890 [Fonsecaea pedrosoi CBS 271.37]